MSANNPKDSTVSQMIDLFGEPPLMKGEDKDRYWRLHAAIEHELKPETLSDKIYVREFTDKLWQHLRCKQSAASIVDGSHIEALASLLRPFNPPTISIDEDAATTMARDYYSGDADAKRVDEVDFRLALYAISSEQIRAKAIQLCGNSVLMFNRMETNCETSLRMLRKERDGRSAARTEKVPGPDKGAQS